MSRRRPQNFSLVDSPAPWRLGSCPQNHTVRPADSERRSGCLRSRRRRKSTASAGKSGRFSRRSRPGCASSSCWPPSAPSSSTGTGSTPFTRNGRALRRRAGDRRRRQRVLVPDAPHRRPRPPGQVPHLRHAPVQRKKSTGEARRCRPASSAVSNSRPTASRWPAFDRAGRVPRHPGQIEAAGFVEFDETKLTRITTTSAAAAASTSSTSTSPAEVDEGRPVGELYSPDLDATMQNLLDAHHAGNKRPGRDDPRRLQLWGIETTRSSRSSRPASRSPTSPSARR